MPPRFARSFSSFVFLFNFAINSTIYEGDDRQLIVTRFPMVFESDSRRYYLSPLLFATSIILFVSYICSSFNVDVVELMRFIVSLSVANANQRSALSAVIRNNAPSKKTSTPIRCNFRRRALIKCVGALIIANQVSSIHYKC